MNKRLQDTYSDIQQSNSRDFLSNRLKIDEMWKKPTWGITLQIDLGENVKDAVCDFQMGLNKMERGNLLLLPRKCQHISFNQVVFWNGKYSTGKKKTWSDTSDFFVESFLKMENVFQSFQVTFSRLIATTGGIIWCGYDKSDELEDMRKYFLSELPFPKETTYLNHIIHTTVVRYKNLLNDPKKVDEYVQSQKKTVTMKVRKIVLRNELVFPSLITKDIASINLK